MTHHIRSVFELIKIFTYGVGISTTFVLITNDLFYDTVFKGKTPFNEKTNVWEEIKPREIFGKGAKATFLKHQISEEKDETSVAYHNYIANRKEKDSQGQVFNNIFDDRNKKL